MGGWSLAVISIVADATNSHGPAFRGRRSTATLIASLRDDHYFQSIA